jgi:hypothetical protein
MSDAEKPATRLYSVLPARAVQDEALTLTQLRILAALCLHTNAAGIAWPSYLTLARHVGCHRATVERYMPALRNMGYIRKLAYKPYPRHIKRKGRGLTPRWQVLYQGAETPVPSREEIYAPVPAVIAEPDDDNAAGDNEEGVRGIDTELQKRVAGAFVAGAAAAGQHRLLEPQLAAAALLVVAGRSPAEIREYTIAACQAALEARRSPPSTLMQVAKWAGLL